MFRNHKNFSTLISTVLTVSALSSAPAATAAEVASTPREVHFPDSYAIGKVSLLTEIQAKKPVLSPYVRTKALGPAKNTIIVPPGKLLWLETNSNFYRHSSDLHTLRADALDRLSIRFSSFSDEDETNFVDAMKEVGRLSGLKELILDKSDVQDSMLGLNLNNLRRLDCNLTPIKGEFLGKLTAKILQTLRLNETSLNEENLKYLNRFPELRFLTVKHCRITTIGINHICSGAPNLKVLDIGDNSQVNDDNIGKLTALKKLCSISLVNTKITNAGLKKLASIKSLAEITLPQNSYSNKELEEIKRLLPGVSVGTIGKEIGKINSDDRVIFAPLH